MTRCCAVIYSLVIACYKTVMPSTDNRPEFRGLLAFPQSLIRMHALFSDCFMMPLEDGQRPEPSFSSDGRSPSSLTPVCCGPRWTGGQRASGMALVWSQDELRGATASTTGAVFCGIFKKVSMQIFLTALDLWATALNRSKCCDLFFVFFFFLTFNEAPDV